MAKRPRKPTKSYYAPNDKLARRMQDALVRYDEAVTKLEMKWGVDRLPWLVGRELREKFDMQMDRLNEAIERQIDIEHQVEVTLRGLAALEKAATEKKIGDPLTGEYWEAPMPDGRVIAITRTDHDVVKVKRENREMVVYSVNEVGKIVQAYLGKASAVDKVKDLWPGATIEKIKTPAEKELNDEIPF